MEKKKKTADQGRREKGISGKILFICKQDDEGSFHGEGSMSKDLKEVRERNEHYRYVEEAHSSGGNSKCKGPGQERTWYVGGIARRPAMLSEQECGRRQAREVLGVGWRGGIDPQNWYTWESVKV